MESLGRFLRMIGIGRGIGGRTEARHVGQRRRRVEFRFLQAGVEADIGRTARGGLDDLPGAQDRFLRGGDRSRLVVPFGVMADERALILRGVNPVDPRPAFCRIDRPGRAQQQQRCAVAPGVENRHGGVHQPDIGMDDRHHGRARDLGPAMGDGDGAFLMQRQQHLRALVTQPVDQAVMQAAIARAGVERHIGNVERAQQIGHGITAPDAAGRGGLIGRQRALDAFRLVAARFLGRGGHPTSPL